ncbi:hypothetical protein E9531_00300 [Lampropedia puyangensis]|uniref:Uncharacterized protein n=1 Tax=Lampropedia puyangensis TaxID=1330072 RepID=A0A4S8FEA1_9BURK|nr:hypothetical protein [Lampropedia puyangensis]THU05034.1 hypothetical protein E9531_00300 [Lampropedia puyangensis]
MSLALYIVLNDPEPGFDTFVDGKALASATDEVDALCEEAGLPLLDSFVGQSEEELDGFAHESDDPEDDNRWDDETPTGGQWWDAAEGVAWLQGVMELIEENPDALDDAEGVLSDMGDFLHVLEKAQAARLHWHFAWDF